MTGSTTAALWDDDRLQHADASLTDLESAIQDLADQLDLTGGSPVPVLRARYLLAVQRHGHPAAAQEFERWVAAIAQRDADDASPIASASAAASGLLPWCPHCELADQVEHLAALGEHERAAELALQLLAAPPSTLCPQQPAGVIALALPSLLLTGQATRATGEHLRGIRLLGVAGAEVRRLAGAPPHDEPGCRARAGHLLLCARTGRLQHGLDLLEDWLGWLPEAGPPFARMRICAAAARVLREVSEAGQGDLVLDPPPGTTPDGLPPDPLTVDALGAQLTRQARDLAAQFDARNQAQGASDLVDDVLDAEPLPDLPLDALLRSPRTAVVAVRRPSAPHGRRAAGAIDSGQTAPGADPQSLVREFELALATDSAARRTAVLQAWTTIRPQFVLDLGETARDLARLDAWLSIERLQEPAAWRAARRDGDPVDDLDPLDPLDPLESALAAGRQLAATGLAPEALLHEQAVLFAAAQDGLVQPSAVRARIEEIATEVITVSGVADQGLAHSRVALIHELMITDGPVVTSITAPAPAEDAPAHREPRLAHDRNLAHDPVELGLAAFDVVPLDELGHQHRRALCRLLRLRAGDEPPDEAADTLRHAIEVLPDGIRPLERALARTDLASLVQEHDPAAALQIWQDAVADAAGVDAEPLVGTLLAAGAQARRAVGDVPGAIADLTEAVPLLDRFSAPELAAQARFDLSRVLLAAQRYDEAAVAAESALADLTDLMTERLAAAPDAAAPDENGADGESDELTAAQPTLAHLAGCAAFAAAEAIAATGDLRAARVLAELSAGWHESNGNLVAEAEAWQLAARIGGPARQVAVDLERAAELAEAGGEWSRAATCRRDRASAVKEADGVEAALAVLHDAEKALASRDPVGRHASQQDALAATRLMTWHRLVLSEQKARLLAVAGRFRAALTAIEGLEDGYLSLGDAWSARDLLGLRGQLLAEVDDLPGALADLERAAQSASDAGDLPQARGLGERLAMVLDQAGRPDDAERAYQRYCEEPFS